MQTTFVLKSAEDLDKEFLDKVKKTFKNKPITITVEDESEAFVLTREQIEILTARSKTPIEDCLVAEETIRLLRVKHGI